jgi:hypothetical protein
MWSRAVVAAGLAALGLFLVGAPSNAGAATSRGAQPGATVRFIDTSCKVGFLMHHRGKVYAAIPASCTGLTQDEGKQQNGCSAPVSPIGTPGRISGVRHRAVMVYNSFSHKQNMGVRKHSAACRFNDLALLRLNRHDVKSARGEIPGTTAPTRVSSRAPANGSQLSFDGSTAVSGGSSNGGWVYPMTSAPSVTGTDIGTPFVQGGRLVGMLTLIPDGVVLKSDTAAYNLHRAIHTLHRTKGFHHVTLLRRGQRP